MVRLSIIYCMPKKVWASPGPVYEELRADQMEMKGNVAYEPSKKLPLEQNVHMNQNGRCEIDN